MPTIYQVMAIWIMSRFLAVTYDFFNYKHNVLLGLTPKWFSKANMLFYPDTDLRLAYKCLLIYSTPDVVTAGRVRDRDYDTGDNQTTSSSPFWEKLETFWLCQVSFWPSPTHVTLLSLASTDACYTECLFTLAQSSPSEAQSMATECPIPKATFFLFSISPPLKLKYPPLLTYLYSSRRPSPQMQSCAKNWWALQWQGSCG